GNLAAVERQNRHVNRRVELPGAVAVPAEREQRAPRSVEHVDRVVFPVAEIDAPARQVLGGDQRETGRSAWVAAAGDKGYTVLIHNNSCHRGSAAAMSNSSTSAIPI